MINDIRINDNWTLHTLENEEEAVFNREQTNLLHSFFTEEITDFLANIIQKKLLAAKENDLVQLEIPPFQFFIFKDQTKAVTAVFKKKEALPGVRIEQDAAAMEASFIARSAKMKDVMEIVKKISYVDSTILLLGKSGVGKSVIAKLIHKYSSRSSKSFTSVNCGAIPEPLMEAELFGYSHGSFTGGQKGGKQGIFESANEGTVFLDEIGELPLNLQVKLLEVLQEKSIRPIGSAKLVSINVRIIAATNQNLLQLVQQKKFREDLYYRLNVVPIEIPALSERAEDIPHLSRYFLNQQMKKYGIHKTIHPDVEEVFKRYDWPGNVRELENMMERLFITTDESEIQLSHLPVSFHSVNPTLFLNNEKTGFLPLKEAKKLVEKDLITRAYNLYQSTYKAAEVLGVDQSTIAKKLKEFREEDGNKP